MAAAERARAVCIEHRKRRRVTRRQWHAHAACSGNAPALAPPHRTAEATRRRRTARRHACGASPHGHGSPRRRCMPYGLRAGAESSMPRAGVDDELRASAAPERCVRAPAAACRGQQQVQRDAQQRSSGDQVQRAAARDAHVQRSAPRLHAALRAAALAMRLRSRSRRRHRVVSRATQRCATHGGGRRRCALVTRAWRSVDSGLRDAA